MKKERTMTRISACLLICGLIVFWGFQAFGEEWNAEQKEVIKAVEARWEAFKKNDLKTYMAAFHKDGLRWSPMKLLLDDKISAEYEYSASFDGHQSVSYKIEILNVQIVGNVAIVYSLYEWKNKDTPGYSGREMLVMVKQDNKWKIMGLTDARCGEVQTITADYKCRRTK
ncbi:YybH family protein [Thermodesulfobacteriota bacterium]